MGIPTGPQQGRIPGRGGLPTGRDSGNKPSSQQRPRGNGIPRQEPQRPSFNEEELPLVENTEPLARPASSGDRSQQRRPSSAIPERVRRQNEYESRPVSSPRENKPFAFENEDDLFSDVPKYQDSFEDDIIEDDGTFESIDPEDDSYDDIEEKPVEQQKTRSSEKLVPVPAAKPRRVRGATKAPEKSSKPDDEYSDEFVDKENLKLKPFGSGKQKKKAKVGDFDTRKNIESQRKIYRGVFIGAMIAIVGTASFITFVPKENLSENEVQSIVAEYVGETGFPTKEGEGFALNFMESLLNVQPGENATTTRNTALSYFYGGQVDGKSFDSALTTVGDVKQNIIYGPVVFDSTPITGNSASYEIGVLVKTVDAAAKDNDSTSEAKVAESLRWMAFNVNVYYDDLKQSFAIAPNSPSLIPAPPVAVPGSIPTGEPLGELVDTPPESIKATVEGFLSGYRESSKENTDKILQYIGTEANEDLRDGLDSRYQFATPNDLESSITYEVYSPNGPSDLSELKIDLTVDWQIPTSSDSAVTFPSHYVLTLENKGSGDYTVTKFAPYYWVEGTEVE